MSIVIVDIFCVFLVGVGIAMVLKSPAHRPRGATLLAEQANGNPLTYVLRIAGR